MSPGTQEAKKRARKDILPASRKACGPAAIVIWAGETPHEPLTQSQKVCITQVAKFVVICYRRNKKRVHMLMWFKRQLATLWFLQ